MRYPVAMKKPLLVALLSGLVLLSLPVAANAATLALQGGLRNAAAGPIADGKYVFVFRLYDALAAQQFVWEESLDVPVKGGGFAVTLGAAAKAIPDALLSAGKPLWIGLKVGVEPELPRQPVGRVPSAWFAHVAAGLDCTGCVKTEALAADSVTADKAGFPYAGSATKGGPATIALQAKEASHAAAANNADKAKLAEQAVNATKAASADLAADLNCKGCVALAELDADVANGYLATSGGKVQGKVEVAGELALGGSAISGGRFAAVDISKAACAANVAGQVVLDSKTARLFFCDGKSWRRISSCLAQCKTADQVPCGAPISNDCGDLGACAGTGTFCPPQKECKTDKCVPLPGMAAESAGKDCKALLALGVKDSGAWWIDPAGKGQAFRAWCDMKTDGGGWTRCGHIDEAKANNTSLVIHEAAAPVTHSQMLNKSWCSWMYQTAKPQALLVHNQTKGAAFGEGHMLKIHWGASPFTLYNYNNHKIAECRNLSTNKVWAGCQYSAHSGWTDTSFSFTVNGLNSGYSGNASSRLILGPTAKPGGDKNWHNFGADSNAQNVANSWVGGLAVGMLYMR